MNLFPKDPPVHTRYSLLFKLFVVAGMVAVVLLFVIYTQSIISKLQGDAVRISGVYAKLWQLAASDATSGPEINVIFEEVIQKSNFPIIITDPNNIPQFWKEVDVAADDTTLQGRNMLTAILKKIDKGAEPNPIF